MYNLSKHEAFSHSLKDLSNDDADMIRSLLYKPESQPCRMTDEEKKKQIQADILKSLDKYVPVVNKKYFILTEEELDEILQEIKTVKKNRKKYSSSSTPAGVQTQLLLENLRKKTGSYSDNFKSKLELLYKIICKQDYDIPKYDKKIQLLERMRDYRVDFETFLEMLYIPVTEIASNKVDSLPKRQASPLYINPELSARFGRISLDIEASLLYNLFTGRILSDDNTDILPEEYQPLHKAKNEIYYAISFARPFRVTYDDDLDLFGLKNKIPKILKNAELTVFEEVEEKAKKLNLPPYEIDLVGVVKREDRKKYEWYCEDIELIFHGGGSIQSIVKKYRDKISSNYSPISNEDIKKFNELPCVRLSDIYKNIPESRKDIENFYNDIINDVMPIVSDLIQSYIDHYKNDNNVKNYLEQHDNCDSPETFGRPTDRMITHELEKLFRFFASPLASYQNYFKDILGNKMAKNISVRDINGISDKGRSYMLYQLSACFFEYLYGYNLSSVVGFSKELFDKLKWYAENPEKYHANFKKIKPQDLHMYLCLAILQAYDNSSTEILWIYQNIEDWELKTITLADKEPARVKEYFKDFKYKDLCTPDKTGIRKLDKYIKDMAEQFEKSEEQVLDYKKESDMVKP